MALIHISVILVAVTAVLYQLEVSFEPLVASGTVILMRNREDSFKYAANVPHYHKWTLMVSSAEEVSTSHMKAGKTFHLYSDIPLLGRQEIPTKVVVYKPYHRLDIQTHLHLLEMRISMNFTDTHKDDVPFTKLDCAIHAKRRSYLYYSTLLQGLRFVMKSQLKGSLLNMKLLLQT